MDEIGEALPSARTKKKRGLASLAANKKKGTSVSIEDGLTPLEPEDEHYHVLRQNSPERHMDFVVHTDSPTVLERSRDTGYGASFSDTVPRTDRYALNNSWNSTTNQLESLRFDGQQSHDRVNVPDVLTEADKGRVRKRSWSEKPDKGENEASSSKQIITHRSSHPERLDNDMDITPSSPSKTHTSNFSMSEVTPEDDYELYGTPDEDVNEGKSELHKQYEKHILQEEAKDLFPPRAMSPPLPRKKNLTSTSTQSSLTSSLFKSLSGGISQIMSVDQQSERSLQSSSALLNVTVGQTKARNFLVGRAGSQGAGVMGTDELERFFPDRQLHIFTGTWNMCEMSEIPESLDDFLLSDTTEFTQDMYVISTQESTADRREWEIKLQETLGPQYVIFHTATFGVLYMCILLKRDLMWFCSVVEESSVSTRAGPAAIKTKGGLGVCLTFFGTSLLFVNSHLSPHDGHAKDRVADFCKIIKSLDLPKSTLSSSFSMSSVKDFDDVTSNFDNVFWMGDLNFRIEKSRAHVSSKVDGIEAEGTKDFGALMQHDELNRVRNEGEAFHHFQEGRIKFKPTYKYDIGTNNYDSSKKMRIPSYTDRILYRSKKKNGIACLHYDTAQTMCHSDHKPVYAMFEISIRPGKDNILLSGGQFKRDIWIEGIRRRALRFEKKSDKSSTVCVLQ